MVAKRFREIIRRFKENGIKLLLENPETARELLALLGSDLLDLIDLSNLQMLRTTFVKRDWRHVESDVLLSASLRAATGQGRARRVLVYILIEHQSEPDRLMPFRMLEYVVEVFKGQLRGWSREHTSFSAFSFQPVLPVVFYTGLRSWHGLGDLLGLIERGQEFAQVTPILRPLFLSLQAVPAEILERKGGCFGQVLRLLREPGRAKPAFQALL